MEHWLTNFHFENYLCCEMKYKSLQRVLIILYWRRYYPLYLIFLIIIKCFLLVWILLKEQPGYIVFEIG